MMSLSMTLATHRRARRAFSHQSSSCQSRNISTEFVERLSDSPSRHGRHSAAMDVMSQALQRAARSPFSDEIERTQMPIRFNHPPFIPYDGKVDPIEHVSH